MGQIYVNRGIKCCTICRMKHCQSHCRSCHSHFATDTAFDLHRQFEKGHEGDWDYRICADLHAEDRLEIRGYGVCDISDPSTPKFNVPIFGLVISEAKQESLRRMRASKAA